jgi:hypothetical protein
VVFASLILALVAGGAQAPADTADALAARAAAYLDVFQKDFARVIGEERYVQTLTYKRVSDLANLTQVERRDIEAEIVSSQDAFKRWVTFRDVIAVEGRPVRDRDQRLEKLFLADGGNAANRFDEARRIAEEGTRFNLGTVQRTVNLPTMPLVFLTAENLARMRFKLAGRDQIGGVDVAVVEFREAQRPTIVRSGRNDLPASGRAWIEPVTGRVMRASVSFESKAFKASVTTTFGFAEKLSMWLPVSMEDVTSNDRETVKGEATYPVARYRRFATSVVIK